MVSPNYKCVISMDFFRWLHSLSGAEWKVMMYLLIHTHCQDKPDERLSFDELLQGRMEQGKSLNDFVRVDYGTGLSEKYLELALESLIRDGLVTSHKFLLDGKDYYALHYHNLTDPEGRKKVETAINWGETDL